MAQRGRCRYADPRTKCHCACGDVEHGIKGFHNFLQVTKSEGLTWNSSDHAWNAYLMFLDWERSLKVREIA